MAKATEYTYTSKRLDGIKPLDNFRDIEGLVYNADGTFYRRTPAEQLAFDKTAVVEGHDKIVALIKRIDDGNLKAFSEYLVNRGSEEKNVYLKTASQPNSVYDAEGFPVAGPANLVWWNLQRVTRGKVYTKEWFDSREYLIGKLASLVKK